MSEEPTRRRGRDIPWLSVIRFHKEIAARAENSFFSISARDANAERWSSINDYQPSDLAGPWDVEGSKVVSSAFKLGLEQGSHESIFIGGPCYLGWEKGFRGGWSPQWRPIFYREVRVLSNGGVLEVLPEQGNWSLSPVVASLIERLQVSAGRDLDALSRQVIEAAVQKTKQVQPIPFSEALKAALVSELPDLEEELSKQPRADTFQQTPSPWVFFAPTTNFSALTRYLMSDYQRLESLLEENEGEKGGLSVLDDGAPMGILEKPKVLPLVPLNASQQKAVECILGNQPLTVISGPPGCGKSQVVVSLLLNAWAAGKSVLFASNNNNAVDVVRDRLEKFESEFPLAVRAGNRQKNNIVELLRRTINYASDTEGAGSTTVAQHQDHRTRLLEERKRLEKRLEDKLPHRANEGLRTALNAYGEYKKKHELIAEESAKLDESKKQLELEKRTYGWIASQIEKTQGWLDKLASYQSQEQEDLQQVELENRRIDKATRERNGHVEGVGLDHTEIQEWGWLIDGPSVISLDTWEEKFTRVLAAPIEEALESFSWEDGFSRWDDADEAKITSTRAKAYAKRVRTHIAELAPRVANISLHLHALEDATTLLHKHGLEEKSTLTTEDLQSWAIHYSELISLPPTRLNYLPWKPSSKLRRKLKKLESVLRSALPLSKWREIGPLNQDGRDRLSEYVEVLRLWREALDRWQELGSERASVEKTFEQLRAEAGALSLATIPQETDPKEWMVVVEEADRLAKYSASASEAWGKKVKREQALTQIADLTRSWRSLASGQPLKEAWCKGPGDAFVAALEALQRDSSTETFVNARTAYFAGTLKVLHRTWEESTRHQQAIVEAQTRIRKIPTRMDRVHIWYGLKPVDALVLPVRPDDWPDIDKAQQRILKVQRFCAAHSTFNDDRKPRLIEEAKQEYQWAVDKLKDAISILPDSEEQKKLLGIYDKVRTEPSLEWPVAKITQGFREFSPEIIHAKIDHVNSELERGAFEDAKAAWLNRLSEDEEAVNAVDQLEKAIRRQRGQIEEKDFDLFRKSLRLVPIWITTAQAAQAIPLLPELFDLVVIDEASQCTLTNLLPLLFRGKRLAIIGDSDQLPAIPTIQENEELSLARKHKVEEYLSIIGHASNDVYSAAADALPRGRAGVVQLNEHFRSNPQIIGFSNRHIYQQRLLLQTDPSKNAHIPIGPGVHRENVSGTVVRGDRGRSWKNSPEAEKVLEVISKLAADSDMRHLSIGVVTPFAAQKEHLRGALESRGKAGEILVDSAYGFQGDERDVIIFSPVVSKGITASASRWVESPPNLINVALTRARHALIVVADFDYCLQQDPSGVLHKLAIYCRDIQILRDTSEAELELYSWMIVEGWMPAIHPRVGDIEVDFMLNDNSGVRVAIEVDGKEYHDGSNANDESRDAFLHAQGCRILRTSARAVLETPHQVIHRIKDTLTN